MPKQDLILLALDDSSPVSLLIERALHAVSYKTAIARDRDAVNRVIQESTPVLVLVGEVLDGEQGTRIASDLLNRFPTMPVLLYIENESLPDLKELLRLGITGYLSPPLRNDDIVGAIERNIKRAKHLGDWVRQVVKRTTASLENRISLSEAEIERYETIFSNVQDGVLIFDPDGRIQFINKAMLSTFELKGDSKNRLVEETITHPDFQALLTRIRNKPLKYHELNFDDGRVFNAQFTPIEGIGSVITMQDISYLKQLDRMKSEFINTVSHDLRSPLTSVMGYTELIDRVGPLNKQQSEFVNHIRASIESITTLVNDLLDISRLEAGFDTRREFVQVGNILNFALDTLGGQIALNEIELDLDIASDLPEVRANPIRLRQLLDNLIGNAIKYTPKGGKVSIKLAPEEHQIIFSISDTGPGIPKEEQNRIFEKFYRASNVSPKVAGSGLGLSIVKSIVEAHNGRIWVESVLGEGSTFFVVLPAVESD